MTIPTFGAIAALGLVLAIALAARCARRAGVSEDAMWTLCLWTAAGTLLLSRLIIVAQVPRSFLHYPLYILSLPTVTRYGLLAALISALAYMLWKRMPLLRTADALAPGALLLQATLHLGSLFAGDDLGAPTQSWLGHLVPGDPGYHPVALYASLFSLLACGVAVAWLPRERQPGETLGLALAAAALIRFFVDQLRPDYVLPTAVRGGFLRTDQLVLIALTACGMAMFFQRRPRHAE